VACNRVNGKLLLLDLVSGYNHPRTLLGNLALSRALGDFQFKRNKDLTPEEQIVTGRCGAHVCTDTNGYMSCVCSGPRSDLPPGRSRLRVHRDRL